jgi:hypothetical protein
MFVTDVSGKRIGSIFTGGAVQEECQSWWMCEFIGTGNCCANLFFSLSSYLTEKASCLNCEIVSSAVARTTQGAQCQL